MFSKIIGKERVMAKRAGREKSWEERFQEWYGQQRAERIWILKQAETARQGLRVQLAIA